MSIQFNIHLIGLTDAQLALGSATAKQGRDRQENLGKLHVVQVN